MSNFLGGKVTFEPLLYTFWHFNPYLRLLKLQASPVAVHSAEPSDTSLCAVVLSG
jgi:hypothetical protein